MNRDISVITAPDTNTKFTSIPPIKVFLAGGITGCENWQKEVIEAIHEISPIFYFEHLCIFNPRRDDFDVTYKNAELEQIKWEHDALESCHIFSCFFAASDSVQPITLYEFGKWSKNKPTIATVQKGYLRETDVITQSQFDGVKVVSLPDKEAIRRHAIEIMVQVEKMQDDWYEQRKRSGK